MSRNRAIAILLILLHALLATAYSAGNPLAEAPDEADHWAYVVYLARERSLPEGSRVTQSKHPPFYHIMAAAAASLATPSFEFLRANPDVAIHPGPTQSASFFIHTTLEQWPWRAGALAFHLARLWSVLLSSATVAAVYGLGRSALPARPEVALLATALTATLPEFAFIGGAINNDNAAALFGTLALWGGFAIFQANGSWQPGWWTPLALGLGLLSKASTLTLWPVVALCIMLGSAQTSNAAPSTWHTLATRGLKRWSTWLSTGAIVFLPALVIAAPWLLRNWRLYGDPSGMALVQQTIDLRTTPWGWEETLWLLQGWFLSFWGKFGAVGQLPFPSWLYWLVGGITLLGVLGLGVAWRVAVRHAPRECISIVLLTMAAMLVAFGMWRYSLIALGTDQGRLLFPAIAPLMVLLALGLCVLTRPWLRPWLGAGLTAALTCLAIYGLVGIIQPAFAPPPTANKITGEIALALPEGAPLNFGELSLNTWTLQGNPILYWHASQPPTQDWRANLRVIAEDGTLVWEWRRSPGYGRFSSDHWPAGTTVRDEYNIQWPEWAAPGRYHVEVTLYPFGGEPGESYPHTMIGWLEKTN